MLRASLNPVEFEWVASSISDFGLVKSVVPEGLAAYCRVIHPDAPGRLSAEALAILGTAVARHTRTPESCFFCLWEGHGWIRQTGTAKIVFTPIGMPVASEEEHVEELTGGFREAIDHAIHVNLPGRIYSLLEGPLAAAGEFGWNLTATFFVRESPDLLWPKDHAWCMATDIDLGYTLICGSEELVAELMAAPGLDVSRVRPTDRLAGIRCKES